LENLRGTAEQLILKGEGKTRKMAVGKTKLMREEESSRDYWRKEEFKGIGTETSLGGNLPRGGERGKWKRSKEVCSK